MDLVMDARAEKEKVEFGLDVDGKRRRGGREEKRRRRGRAKHEHWGGRSRGITL